MGREATRESADVEYDGRWYPAEITGWTWRSDGMWWAHVTLRRGVGRFLDIVPETRVRTHVYEG